MDKKKITNSADLNNYYKMVSDKIKKFSDVNIPYNKIASYLKPGSQNFNDFIEEDNTLKDVEGIHTVVKDVIMDIYHAFKDGLFKRVNKEVKTFENINADGIFNISDVGIKDKHEHEKALADIYGVATSYIELVKKDIHLYSVNHFGTIKKVIVFTTEELDGIKANIVDKLANDIRERVTDLLFKKQISLGDLIGQTEINTLISKKISIEDVLEYISQNTGLDVKVKYSNRNELNGINYYLFEVTTEPLGNTLF